MIQKLGTAISRKRLPLYAQDLNHSKVEVASAAFASQAEVYEVKVGSL